MPLFDHEAVNKGKKGIQERCPRRWFCINAHKCFSLLIVLLAALFILPCTGIAAASDTENHWARYYTDYVENEGLFQGVATNTFAPEESMTRAMVITVLHRMEESPAADGSKFRDVANGSWYSDAVYWGYENNLINGEDNYFYPNRYISRQEVCVMLANYLDYTGVELPQTANGLFPDDAQIEAWAKGAVYRVSACGLVTGSNGGYLKPQATLTRAECAVIICRLMGYDFGVYTPVVTTPPANEESKGVSVEIGKLAGTFTSTFYCSGSCCNGIWAGKTTSGATPTVGRTIAVDPSVIPLGTKVRLVFNDSRLSKYNGVYVAEDTGSAIKGKRIDVLLASHGECNSAGVGQVRVYIL